MSFESGKFDWPEISKFFELDYSPDVLAPIRHQLQEKLYKALQIAGNSGLPAEEWLKALNEAYYVNLKTVERDFLTPPEMFPQMGACIAKLVFDVYQAAGSPDKFDVFEFGAGNGTLALSFFEKTYESYPQLFQALTYHIFDLSPDLIIRQQQRLQTFAGDGKVRWHKGNAVDVEIPPTDFGIAIFCEFFDDLPHSVVMVNNGQIYELKIVLENNQIYETLQIARSQIEASAHKYPSWLNQLPDSFIIPFGYKGADLMAKIACRLTAGGIIAIDYGFRYPKYLDYESINPPFRLFYNGRKVNFFDGSPLAHAIKYAIFGNPTTYVDFDLLSDPLIQNGFEISIYNQSDLLAALGMPQVIHSFLDTHRLPSEMIDVYLRKLIQLIDYQGWYDWTALVATRGLGPIPEYVSNLKRPDWIYQLGREYTSSDLTPSYRQGLIR